MSANDTKIKELLKKVEGMKEALGRRPKASLETNGVFKYDAHNHIHINVVGDLDTILKACAFLLLQEESIKKAEKLLGVNSGEKVVWDGYYVEDWITDFKTRASILDWQNKNNKLKATKDQLNQLISEDAKTELALEAIEEDLGI